MQASANGACVVVSAARELRLNAVDEFDSAGDRCGSRQCWRYDGGWCSGGNSDWNRERDRGGSCRGWGVAGALVGVGLTAVAAPATTGDVVVDVGAAASAAVAAVRAVAAGSVGEGGAAAAGGPALMADAASGASPCVAALAGLGGVTGAEVATEASGDLAVGDDGRAGGGAVPPFGGVSCDDALLAASTEFDVVESPVVVICTVFGFPRSAHVAATTATTTNAANPAPSSSVRDDPVPPAVLEAGDARNFIGSNGVGVT